MVSKPLKVEETLRNAAIQRDALLDTIATTEHAASTLSEIKTELQELTNHFYEADKTYGTLAAAAQKEKADVDELQKRHLRKIFNREKFNKKLEKEEDDYIEALQWKEKAAMKRDFLRSEADEMKKNRAELEKMSRAHLEAIAALDDFLRATQETYDSIQSRLTRAAEVVNNLALAQMRIRSALVWAGRALKSSSQDIADHPPPSSFGTHGMDNWSSALEDKRERGAVGWVQRNIAEAEHFMAIAQDMDPEVGGFFGPEVADGDGVAGTMDQVVNTLITDYLFHTEIKSTWQGVYDCGLLLEEELNHADSRKANVEKERDLAGAALKETRGKLLNVRRDLLEQALKEKEDKD
ncbi:Fc.00g115720.m01.CDS01 [Cosmosporella sp. VM-42]